MPYKINIIKYLLYIKLLFSLENTNFDISENKQYISNTLSLN